ncbi:hypothetical protein, partial [Brucella sp. NBRC 12952]|uniref:hypothetical protein n=1 Tax=Brucella sp. NBRC 12952 TaxID=3075480 RepID=UPI0033402327
MKRIVAVLIASGSLASNAYALHPSDIIDNPSKFSDLWTRSAVQAFSCKNVDYESTLKVVQFDDHFYEFPRFEGDPKKDDRISSLTRPTNTLILSEGMATDTTSIAGRSLFGASEDTPTHLSAGHYTAVTAYPNFDPAKIGKGILEQDRLLEGSEVQFKGVVLDKNSGRLTALISQNQASSGEPPKFENNEEEFLCTSIPKDDVVEFADKSVRTLLASMAKVRKEVAGSFSHGAKTHSTPPIAQTMPPEDDVSAEYDAGPVGNLENPGPYIAQVSKQTKFALTCKNVESDRIRIAMFEHPLRGFPILKIEHNEDELKRDKIYTKDRLQVTAKVRSAREPRSRSLKMARHALVIVDYQLGDEIYPVGLSFIADLAEDPNAYEGRGTQLRASSELPEMMRPKIKNEYGELNVMMNNVKIDRVTGDTTLTMSWFLVPALHIKHKCTISKQP